MGGPIVFFLILAIVSITGKVAASSHNSRNRRRGNPEVYSERIEMEMIDKKAVHENSLNGRSESPSLPTFHTIRRTLPQSGTHHVDALDSNSREREDLLVRRRKLKATLKIVIPSDARNSRIRPRHSEVPQTYSLYAGCRALGPRATSFVPHAAARSATSFAATDLGAPSRSRAIDRVGMLRAIQREELVHIGQGMSAVAG